MVAQSIQREDELPVYGKGRLPNGVIVNKWFSENSYYGSQERLVEVGLARSEWFPKAPIPGKKQGTFKSVFKYEVEHGKAILTRVGKAWRLDIPVSPEEKAARFAELERAKEREIAERAAQLAAIELVRENLAAQAIRALPQVTSGSLTEWELFAVRVLRGLDDRAREMIVDMMRRLLVREEDVTAALNRPAAPSRLRLVVDNAAPEADRHG